MWKRASKALRNLALAGALALSFSQSVLAATTTWDFESLSNCTTGRESNCQSDNSVDLSPVAVGGDDSGAFQIKAASSFGITAATGSGVICGSGSSGGTGPGFFDEPSPTPSTSSCLGYYVRFNRGWMQNISSTGDHGPALKYAEPGSACAGYISIDHTLENPRIIVEVNNSTCGGNNPTGSGANLTMNVGNWIAKNNQWYHVEICAIMNTTASSSNIQGGGNGTVKMYVDGSEVLSYTNLNIRGASTTSRFDSFFGARTYLGLGVHNHEPDICFDKFTLKDSSSTPVGPDGGANPAGTGDGPYWYVVGADGMEGTKRNSDCSTPGTGTHYTSSDWSREWKSGFSFVGSPDNNDYPCNGTAGDCDGSGGRNVCNTTQSLAATTSAANAGAGNHYSDDGGLTNLTSSTADGIYIHGHIYLDNLPSGSMALAGLAGCSSFSCSTGGTAITSLLGLTVENGHWGLIPKLSGTYGTVHESSENAVADTWTEFEIGLSDANKCSLAINGAWVLDEVTCNQNLASWAFAASGFRFPVIGILDSRAVSSSFTANYDDADVGGASFWSSKGWDAASDPFGDPGPTPTPSPTPAPTLSSGFPCRGQFFRGSRF